LGQTVSFRQSVYPMLQNAGCPACHNLNGVASTTRLHFPDADASPDRVEAFGKSLAALVDRENPQNSLLLRKPTRRVAHGGGVRIKPGSPEEVILTSWIQVLSRLPENELADALNYGSKTFADMKPGQGAVLRRLTHSQYNHTVRDLLSDQSRPADQFPPDDFINGFRDQYEAQNLSPLLAESYSTAAERLAANAFRNGDTHHLIPCKPSEECRSRFIASFGLKAFRRPLKPAEQSRYEALFAHETDFLKGAQLVVEAMLQSPNFLFRLDTATEPNLRPYAAASQLSYSLWDTMPDDALLAAAARGALAAPAGVEQMARSMLQDPRAHEMLEEFVFEWLRIDRVLATTRDTRRYPQFSRETAVAMGKEAQLFIGDLVWNDHNFMTAYTVDYGFMNAELASIYGVEAPAREFDKTAFPPGSERAGLLGQALFLAATSKPEDSSITGRGLFIREQFLCQHVPPPPPGVDTNLAPTTEAHPQTNRERMASHTMQAACASCHGLIDPIGWGFERFDAIGVRRETYRLTFASARREGGSGRGAMKVVTLPLDTNGNVLGLKDSNFASPRELGAILAANAQCQECVVKQFFRYTAGRMETPADRPMISRVLDDFRTSNFKFRQLIVSMVLAREFPSDERSERGATHY
jgi:hypothetical protein